MTADESAAEIARLRLELEHRDQLLASVYARADTLRGSVERLERQLDAATEEQRGAATERAELRRLLGNAQLQVHALMQLPAPEAESDAAGDGAAGEPEPPPPPAATTATRPPQPEATTATRPPQQRAARPRPPARRPRSLLDEARGMFAGLRRMI